MSDFANQIQVFRRKVEARLSEAVRKVTFDLHSMIVQRTPVDTGRARAGWSVDLRPDHSMIYNNVEYIVPLEYGHSRQQAPQGMVRVSIADIVNQWPEIVSVVRREIP